MSDQITIRRVRETELAELLAFAKTTFLATYAHLNTPENMATYVARYFTPEQIAREYDNTESVFYFAEANHTVVGYCKLNWGVAQTEQELPNALEIERIYVAADQQGRGIGGRLIQQAHATAHERGREWIWLGVWEENPRAIRFYERQGFKAFGTHTFLLGEDAQVDVLMRTHPLTPSLQKGRGKTI